MTTRKDHDLDAFRDPDFDAQWREASREEPPASLDATIGAAARREAGARPQSSKASEAPRARRWTPLAIAATLGAITFGVLQLVSTDRLGPTAVEKGVVTDMPAPAAKPPTDSNVPDARPAEKAPAPIAPATEETMSAKRIESRQRSVAPPSSAPSAGAAPGQSPSANAEIAAAPPPIAARPDDAHAGRPPPPTEEPHRRPLPVPESDTGRREATRDERPALPQPFPSSPAQVPAPAAPAPPGAPAPPSFAPHRLQEGATLRAAPAASAPMGQLADRSANAQLAKERANLSVDDWIVLIRRLRDEGRTAEVAKELEAFRTAHLDHERLLPPDLRNWRPPAQ